MHRRIRVRYLVALGAGVLALAAVAASAALSAPQRSNASTILDGTTDTVTNVDPAGNYDYGSFTVDILIYQHLLDFPAGSKVPSPSLATGCKANAAQTAWTCTLKQGVKFSNGDPFTSADVKWSFDRVNKIKDPSGIYSLLSNLGSVTTSGDYSVTFHLKSPQSTWPFILTTGAAFIVDHKVYPADKLVANTDVGNLIGTGPYKLDKFTPGQQAVFTPNPNYKGSTVKNGGVIITYYSKSSTMKLALQQGTIDMAFRDFTPTEYTALGKTTRRQGVQGQRRRHPLSRPEREAGADEQPGRPPGARVPHASPGHRVADLPQPGGAALLDGPGRPARSHERVRRAVRHGAEHGEGEGRPPEGGRVDAGADHALVDAVALRRRVG